MFDYTCSMFPSLFDFYFEMAGSLFFFLLWKKLLLFLIDFEMAGCLSAVPSNVGILYIKQDSMEYRVRSSTRLMINSTFLNNYLATVFMCSINYCNA